MLAELRYYSRMAIGIAQTMRAPVPTNPEERIRARFERRDQTFLELAERVVFRKPDHPYAVMLRLAGCELGDLQAMIRQDGLEPALLRLRREGVYLTHQEWKGKQPIVRAGREIPASPESFKNPFVRGWMQSSSSGSSGRPVTTARSLDSWFHNASYRHLKVKEFGLNRRSVIELKPILPFASGMNTVIHAQRMGTSVDRWFSLGSTFSGSAHYRLMTGAMLTLANLMGARAPYPSYLAPNDFLPVVEHIARRRSEGRECVVQGFTSPLVRVAGTALAKGVDISGTTFMCGGEALTPGKLDLFHAAGARAYASYVISELSHIGLPCQAMKGNTVHLLQDSIAAIVYRRPSPYGEGNPVDSLHFTTLRSHAPLVFINVEMDDEGQLVPATCDCAYSRIGFRTLITGINSFGKMSPQGMTFHGTDLQRVLEVDLPARLGGGLGDYQLVECEAHNQQTQLRLYVSPRVGLADPAQAGKVFLEVMRPQWGGALATGQWIHTGGLEVVVAEPFATRTGKVHPVKLLGATSVSQKSAHA